MIKVTITAETISPASEKALRRLLACNGWTVAKVEEIAPRGRPRSAASTAHIRSMRDKGMSFQAIGEAVGLSEAAIRRRLKQ